MQRLLTILARFERPSLAQGQSRRLPPILVLTDEARGFDLDVQTTTWPAETPMIERTFGQAPAVKSHKAGRGLRLATCTPDQARRAKLDGVHWPQKRLNARLRSQTLGLIETTSAHSGLALAKAARLEMDAILVSTAFESQSPSATRPLGAIRLAKLQRAFPRAKIYALGGVTEANAKRLTRTRIHGVALVSFRFRGK